MTEWMWLPAGILCGAGMVFLWAKARMSSLQTLLQVRTEEAERRLRDAACAAERQAQDFRTREARQEEQAAIWQQRCEELNGENKMLEAGVGCAALTVMQFIEVTSFFILIPIKMYNGKRGWNMKWFFYAFYPVHIFLLYLVACAMGLGQVKLM